LGYVPTAVASQGGGFEIEIIGERHRATRLTGAAYDPKGSLMRS
jgi:hypothetical protein